MFRNVPKMFPKCSIIAKCSEEIIEVVKALAKLPNGDSSPKLLGEVQSKLGMKIMMVKTIKPSSS